MAQWSVGLRSDIETFLGFTPLSANWFALAPTYRLGHTQGIQKIQNRMPHLRRSAHSNVEIHRGRTSDSEHKHYAKAECSRNTSTIADILGLASHSHRHARHQRAGKRYTPWRLGGQQSERLQIIALSVSTMNSSVAYGLCPFGAFGGLYLAPARNHLHSKALGPLQGPSLRFD